MARLRNQPAGPDDDGAAESVDYLLFHLPDGHSHHVEVRGGVRTLHCQVNCGQEYPGGPFVDRHGRPRGTT